MIFFFFSSRRRHTRSLRDWSSDVCSSDLPRRRRRCRDKQCSRGTGGCRSSNAPRAREIGKRREGKSVDLGGRRIIKKKKKKQKKKKNTIKITQNKTATHKNTQIQNR